MLGRVGLSSVASNDAIGSTNSKAARVRIVCILTIISDLTPIDETLGLFPANAHSFHELTLGRRLIPAELRAFVNRKGLLLFRKQLQSVDDDKAYGLMVAYGDGRLNSAFQLHAANRFEMLARRQWLSLIHGKMLFVRTAGDGHGNIRSAGLVCRVAHQQMIGT